VGKKRKTSDLQPVSFDPYEQARWARTAHEDGLWCGAAQCKVCGANGALKKGKKAMKEVKPVGDVGGSRYNGEHPDEYAKDVHPVGDELWTPGHSNPVPPGWLKLSKEAMALAGEAQLAVAKFDRHWEDNKPLMSALRRLNEAQRSGNEAKLRKEYDAVKSLIASKRAFDAFKPGDVLPV
jgi:hypothetical protein